MPGVVPSFRIFGFWPWPSSWSWVLWLGGKRWCRGKTVIKKIEPVGWLGKLHLVPFFVWRRVEQSNLSPLEKNSSGAFGCLARAIRQCSNLENFQGSVPFVLIDLFSLFTGMLYCLPYDMAFFQKLWFYVLFFSQPSQIYKSKSAINALDFCMEGKHWCISRNTTSTSQKGSIFALKKCLCLAQNAWCGTRLPDIALIPARKSSNTSHKIMCIHKSVIYIYCI